MGFIYPPSKLLVRYLDDGLPSKNTRVRSECLGEVGYIFAKNGLHVCTPNKVLPQIAKQISDRDATVRMAALGALSEAYKIVGDTIYDLCGDLPAKERSMLEERLKRMPASKAAATAPRQSTIPGSRLARPSSVAMNGTSGIARRQSALPKPAGSTGLPAPSGLRKPSAVAAPPPQPAAPVPRPASEAADELEDGFGSDPEADSDFEDIPLDQLIHDVTNPAPVQAALALRHIEGYIKEFDPELQQYAEQLVKVFAKVFRKAFSPENETPELEKLRRHLVITATSFFVDEDQWNGKPLGAYVSKSQLTPLLTELLQWLIEATRAPADHPLKKYSKFLNILVLRSFSTCDLNVLYE